MALNEQASMPVADTIADGSNPAEENTSVSARQLIDEAKKHFALKEYTSATSKVADALEELRDAHGEDADVLAPVLHLYGRSLLENFILNSAALGGGGGSTSALAPKAAKASGSSSKAVASDPRFSFSGDGPDDEDDEDGEAPAGEGGDDEGDEEEDDLQVAFTVLDLSRFIYERILSGSSNSASALTTLDEQTWSETRIKDELAQVMNDLGDVGLEGENFQQSSADYRSSLEILRPLLNAHSRRLADAHLRLGLALEFHPEVEERSAAKQHVQAASDVLGTRIKIIEDLIKTRPSSTTDDQGASATTNGKGKSTDQTEKDDLLGLSVDKLQGELAEVKAIKGELDTKLEEYDTDAGVAKLNGEPDLAAVLGVGGSGNTKEALQQAIKDAFLGASDDSSDASNVFGGAASNSGPVNDLSSMVKRKKQATTTEEPNTAQGSASKKARVEEDA